MNRKPFKEIEEQMRASAEGWEPAFDEQAWKHMEKMLDKEDDRRRPLAWWIWALPVLLGIAVGGYFIVKGNSESEGKPVSYSEQQNIVENNKQVLPENKTENSDQKSVTELVPPSSQDLQTNPQQPNGITALRPVNYAVDNASNRSKIKLSTSASSNAYNSVGIENNRARKTDDPGRSSTAIKAAATSSDPIVANPQKEVSGNPDLSVRSSQEASVIQPEKKEKDSVHQSMLSKTKIAEDKPAKKDQKNKSLSKFYFGLSAGMDANGVDFPGLNKFAGRAGLTVGYQLNKNFSVATGFFAGNKKYVAGKDDYKAKAGSYWAMVDIKEVDADCRVFEIPVWLRYDFNKKGSLTPFVSVGLSSFIMDKEDYEYYYYRQGNPYHASHTYKGNQHFFSVLRVAGGVEKKIANNFSLSLQPGISVPLGGVGEGQIKLYSTELLLGLKYRPFKKSK